MLLPSVALGRVGVGLTLAVLLAGCGSTSTNEHAAGSAGTAAGASAGSAGANDGGGASGGRPNGGSSGTTGTAGAHQQAGGAAGRDQGTGGGAQNLCPGSTLDPARATTPQCSTVADCQGANQSFSSPRCQTTPPVYSCGGAAPAHQCDTDADCGTGRICSVSGCGAALCEDACPTKACASYEDCGTNGRCTEKACDAVGALPCGTGTECKSTNGSAATCQAIACNAGITCPATWDCAPAGPKADAHGCVHRACSSSADCACGYCVIGLCEPTPGYCFAYAPPP